jgi:hypothetical protein
MRIGRESAAHAHGIADFAGIGMLDRRQRNVVDLRIRTPKRAPSHRNFEFARQIVELRIAIDLARYGLRQRRSVDEFVAVQAGHRATGHIAHDIAAGAAGGKPHGIQSLDRHRKGIDRKPVQLDGLPRRNIGQIASMIAGQRPNRAQLRCGRDAVGNPDPDHEEFSCFAGAAGPSGHSCAVALGIYAPPFEVELGPFRHHAGATFAGKGAYLLEGRPWIFLPLEAFGTLCFRFFRGRGNGRCTHRECSYSL